MRYMHRIANIALIFTLGGAFLCQDLYALRVPMGLEKARERAYKVRLTEDEIYKKFKTSSERKEALQYSELFVEKLKENGMKYQPFLEEIIPNLVEISRDIVELRMLLSLGMKLAENGIYPRPTLERGIPEVVRLTKNTDESKLFISLAMGLAVNAISPNPILMQGVPVACALAENINELRDLRDYLYILNLKLKRNSMYSWHALNQVFSEAFRVVNDVEEFKVLCRDILSKMTASTVSDIKYSIPLGISSSSIRSTIDLKTKHSARIERLLKGIEDWENVLGEPGIEFSSAIFKDAHGRALYDLMMRLELLSVLLDLNHDKKALYLSMGDDYFLSYFVKTFGVNAFLGIKYKNQKTRIKLLEKEAARKGLPKSYLGRKKDITVLNADNFEYEKYFPEIKKQGDLDLLFIKGLLFNLRRNGEMVADPEDRQKAGSELIKAVDRELIREGGFIVIADQSDLAFEEFIKKELGYRDFLAHPGYEKVNRVLYDSELRVKYLIDDKEQDTPVMLIAGKIPIRIFQKPVTPLFQAKDRAEQLLHYMYGDDAHDGKGVIVHRKDSPGKKGHQVVLPVYEISWIKENFSEEKLQAVIDALNRWTDPVHDIVFSEMLDILLLKDDTPLEEIEGGLVLLGKIESELGNDPPYRFYLAISEPEENGVEKIEVEGFVEVLDNRYGEIDHDCEVKTLEVKGAGERKEEFIGLGRQLLRYAIKKELQLGAERVKFGLSGLANKLFAREGLDVRRIYGPRELEKILLIGAQRTIKLLESPEGRNILDELSLLRANL